MRRIALAFALLLAALGPAAAFDTPEALLTALYKPYSVPFDQFDWASYDEAPLRSTALNALFAKDKAETPDGDIGRLDFDPFVDGQDYDLSGLTIGKPVIAGDTAKVEVTFKNFDQAEDMMFSLVKEPDGWKIDDVVSSNPDFPYSLKAIMSEPMPTDSED
jgi:hypothetical protein